MPSLVSLCLSTIISGYVEYVCLRVCSIFAKQRINDTCARKSMREKTAWICTELCNKRLYKMQYHAIHFRSCVFFLLALCFAFALFSQCKALRCCSYIHTSFFTFVQNQIHNIIIKPLTALRCIFWLCFYQMYAINATENYKRKYNATKRKPVYRDITMQKK